MTQPRHFTRLTADKSDLIWILMAVLATFGLASAVELFERFEKLAGRFERWQLNESIFALISLALGMAWYGWRRRREALAALAQSRQAEERVAGLLAHNRELSQRLISTQERERQELARELHDDVGQFCNAIRVEAELIVHAEPGMLKECAGRIAAVAEDLYARVHALLRRLRPADLDELGLEAALQALCEAWETKGAVACVLHPAGSLDGLSSDVEMVVYRVAQEALSNVMRHARARSVRVGLHGIPGGAVVLEVRDDGVGFDAQDVTRGLGLLGAAERAAAVGGSLEVSSHAGSGTRLRLVLPRNPGAAPA